MSFALNIRKEYLNTSITDTGLKSARNNSIKHKFSFFMQKKDGKKNISSRKRVSDLSPNSSNISDEVGGYLKTSRPLVKYQKKVSDRGILSTAMSLSNKKVFSDRKSLNKEKSNLFSQFQENVKNQPTARGSVNYPRYFSKNYPKKEIKDNFFKDYFSINEIGVNLGEDKLTNKNIQNIVSILPALVLNDISNNIDLKRFENENSIEEINKLLSSLKEDKSILLSLKNNKNEMIEQLKEIKNSRNKLIAEKVVLGNELDFLKSSPHFHNTKVSVERDSKKQVSSKEKGITTGTHTKSQQDSQVMSINTEFDNAIDELENKLSYLKLENSKFFENLDYLNDECAENEEINKSLKNHVKHLDKIIEGLMKERTSLKNSLSKMFPKENLNIVGKDENKNKKVIK